MILLVGDTVVHPGETRPPLSVETSNRLEHSDLSRLSNPAITPSMRALQNPDQNDSPLVTISWARQFDQAIRSLLIYEREIQPILGQRIR